MGYISPFKSEKTISKSGQGYVSPFRSQQKPKVKAKGSIYGRAFADVNSFFASIPRIPFAVGHIIKAQGKYRKTHPASGEWQSLFRGDIKRAFPKGAPATEALKEFTTRSFARTAARAIPGKLEKRIGLKPHLLTKEYSKHPILGPMEDISNVLVLAGGARAIKTTK